jgi:hypothetical protein
VTRQLGVTSDKTQIEHNESALTLTADMPADMDFRYNGPTAEKRSASYSLGKFGSMAYGFNSMSIWIKMFPVSTHETK